MYELSPEEFEVFVGAVWDARGYETEVTQLSNDAGKDVIAKQNGQRIGIQAKRYHQNNRVTGPEIQQYASMLHDETIDDVAIVTSSTYTTAAYRRAQEMGLDLIDGERLLSLADKYRGQATTTSSSSSSETTSSSNEQSGSGVNLLTLPFKFIAVYFAIAFKFLAWWLKISIGIMLLPLKLLTSND